MAGREQRLGSGQRVLSQEMQSDQDRIVRRLYKIDSWSHLHICGRVSFESGRETQPRQVTRR